MHTQSYVWFLPFLYKSGNSKEELEEGFEVKNKGDNSWSVLTLMLQNNTYSPGCSRISSSTKCVPATSAEIHK